MTLSDDQQLKQQIGQLFMCGFPGLEPTPAIIDLIQNHHLGSIILFSRNIESPQQVRNLCRALQKAARDAGHERPLFISVDQENGVVRRLGDSGTYLPGNMGLGAIGSSSSAYRVALATAAELRAMGIQWNLAPVVDVNSNAMNPVIGVRSYGQDPATVARLGLAQVEGYQKGNVAACIKHFPGHGDTATDSHLGVPVVDKDLEALDQIELHPFRQALRGQGHAYPASVMVSHVKLPCLDPNHVSSLSRPIVHDLLRKQLDYKGVIVTDCLEMDAVRSTVGTAQGALLALQAGNDMVTISHTDTLQQEAFHVVTGGLATQLNSQEILRALERVAKFKDAFLSWDQVLDPQPLSETLLAEHALLSQQLYARIPTVVRDRNHLLPLTPSPGDHILFLAAYVPLTLAIDSEKEPFNAFHKALAARHPNVSYVIFDEHTPDVTTQVQQADWVIVGTANANLYPFQVDMVKAAHKHAKRLAVVAVINPYDLMCFPDIDTYVATYEYTPPMHQAAVTLLFGDMQTSSHLPVTIPNTEMDVLPTPQAAEVYQPSDLADVHRLWNHVLGEQWPLDVDKLDLVLKRATEAMHLVVRNAQGELVGFAATQMATDHDGSKAGQLMLLIVASQARHRGVGTLLHDRVLEHFRIKGVNHVKLGATYPRFFPGLPDSHPADNTAQAFFRKRGWQFAKDVVWDLCGHLADYQPDPAVVDRMVKEKIWFGSIQPDQWQELIAFQQRYFPWWVSTYQHHAHLGDFQDVIVARQDGALGRIVASLILYTTHASHALRSDLIWTAPSMFGTHSGGMACVGVAEEERGRHIGLGIVTYANQCLQQRGVEKALVDWVERVGFYQRLGYQPWRSYRLATF